MAIDLTQKDRLFLFNQMMILQELADIKDHLGIKQNNWYGNDYHKHFESLTHGYPIQLEDFFNFISHEMSTDDCDFVHDVLKMYREMIFSLKNLPVADQALIPSFKFAGFDGHSESKYLLYAKFLINDMKQYQEVNNKEFDSPCPMIEDYKRQLAVWENIEQDNKSQMSKEQLLSIINA